MRINLPLRAPAGVIFFPLARGGFACACYVRAAFKHQKKFCVATAAAGFDVCVKCAIFVFAENCGIRVEGKVYFLNKFDMLEEYYIYSRIYNAMLKIISDSLVNVILIYFRSQRYIMQMMVIKIKLRIYLCIYMK